MVTRFAVLLLMLVGSFTSGVRMYAQESRGPEQPLCVEQLPTQFRHFGFGVRLRDGPARLRCFEH